MAGITDHSDQAHSSILQSKDVDSAGLTDLIKGGDGAVCYTVISDHILKANRICNHAIGVSGEDKDNVVTVD